MAKKKTRKRAYGAGGVIPPRVIGGTWSVRTRKNGKRVFQGGLPSKEIAERVLAGLQAEDVAARAGITIEVEEATLGFHAEGFLKRREKTNRAHKEDSGRWKNHLAPTFGHLKPSEVDVAAIRRFTEAKLEEGAASGSVRIHVALLSSLYTDLMERGLAKVNPARGLPRNLVKLLKPSHDPKTTPFIEKLADVDRIYRDLPEPLNVAYAIGALVGMRTGEVFALRWRHVDLATQHIHVRESVKGPLKDGDSRMVVMQDGLLPILKAWKLKTGGEGDDRVIPPMRADGFKIHKQTPGKYLRATLKKLGLDRPGLGWYEATRHTFASQWVINGGSIEKLKEILGHYSVVLTEKTYVHLRVDHFTRKDFATIPLTLGTGPAEIVEIGQQLASKPLKKSPK